MNIKQFVDNPKPKTLNGRWKKLWPETFSDFLWFFSKQQEIRIFSCQPVKSKEKDFYIWMRLISGKFSIVKLHRTEEDLEMMTAFGESDEESGTVVEEPQLWCEGRPPDGGWLSRSFLWGPPFHGYVLLFHRKKNIVPCSYCAPFVPPNLLHTHSWWEVKFWGESGSTIRVLKKY